MLIAWCVQGEEEVLIVPTTPSLAPNAATSASGSTAATSFSTSRTAAGSGDAESETREEASIRRRIEEEEATFLKSLPACLTRAVPAEQEGGGAGGLGVEGEEGGGCGEITWRLRRRLVWAGVGGSGYV